LENRFEFRFCMNGFTLFAASFQNHFAISYLN
jgi:hypothetical protein